MPAGHQGGPSLVGTFWFTGQLDLSEDFLCCCREWWVFGMLCVCFVFLATSVFQDALGYQESVWFSFRQLGLCWGCSAGTSSVLVKLAVRRFCAT